MILQALKEYYDRKSDLPRPGFELKDIPFVLTLKEDGTPVALTPTYEGVGRARRAKRYLIPQGVKRSANIAANLLWDNPEYVFGVVLKGKPERVKEQHEAFINRIDELGISNDQGLEAVKCFLARPDKIKRLEEFGDSWDELKKTGANVSFQLAGQVGLIVERPAIQSAIMAGLAGGGADLCLATGNRDVTEQLHTAIKGVWGAQSSGANIVSFNLEAFCSFGKAQGANAPVGKSAAFAYTTALNHLLGKDSRQRMQVGDASTVFWSSRESKFEADAPDFFSEPPKDDPDRGTRAVEALFRSVQTGALAKEEGDTRFYVLGLSPNASRIAVRFWMVDTVPNMATRFCQHFEDIRIAHGPQEASTLSLFRLLVATASLGKSENIPPNIAGDAMRAILEGRPYPHSLLQAAIRRIRAEHEVSYPRAALIKACINRANRFKKHQRRRNCV